MGSSSTVQAASTFVTGKNPDGSNSTGTTLAGVYTDYQKGMNSTVDAIGQEGNSLFVRPGNEAKKQATDTADKQQAATNAAIGAQKQQQTNSQNQAANATASAQARVRSIQNMSSDGSTFLTPAPSSGSLNPTTGKATLGT